MFEFSNTKMPSKRPSAEERILRSEKGLGLTISQIKAAMDAGGGATEARLKVKHCRGELRLAIRCRHSSHTSWSMSLILNSARFNGRLDCIDWEPLFISIEGKRCNGFHRHIWNAKAMSCDRFKLALTPFQPASAEEFILLGAQLLAVFFKREETPDVNFAMSVR
jgi:hypothetical protein